MEREELVKVALAAAGSAAATILLVFRFALRAKLREFIDAMIEPRFQAIARALHRKVDTEDLHAMEARVTERHEQLLVALERNTGAIAQSLQDLAKSVTSQGREVSELRGAFDAAGVVTPRVRRPRRRRHDAEAE